MNHVYDHFFQKSAVKTGHETLYNYGDFLLPGFVPTNSSTQTGFYTHINYHTMKAAVKTLLENNLQRSFHIVQTGCSPYGTKSALLWDRFVSCFGGEVFCVDENQKYVNDVKSTVSERTTIVCDKTVNALLKLNKPIDFLYLDSQDIDFTNPRPSAEHHYNEVMAVKHLLHKGSVVLIDDTPATPDWLDNGNHNPIYEKYKSGFDSKMCGKGSLVMEELEKMGAKKILHQYQVLYVL